MRVLCQPIGQFQPCCERKTFTWRRRQLHELGNELLSHPPYSPDLPPSNLILFPTMKEWLDGKQIGSNDEVIAEKNTYFGRLRQSLES